MPWQTRLASAAFLAVCLLATVSAVSPASAQGTAELRLELVAQPVWHDADDRLNLRIRVVNDGPIAIEDLDLVVAAYERVRSRSALHSAFDAGAFDGTVASSQLPLPVKLDGPVEPNSSVVVEVRDRVSDLATIDAVGATGVFPLVVTLRDADSLPIASLATPLLYYPDEQDTRLSVVPIITFNDVARRGPRGRFVPDETGAFPLDEALTENGWITGFVDALERAGGLRFGFAPTPRLLEELDDMADGYTRAAEETEEEVPASAPPARAADDVMDRLRQLASRSGVQNMLVPYAAADLPSIASVPNAISAQINAAELTVNELFGRGSRSWVLPTAGRIDESTFEQLASIGVDNLVFSPDSLQGPSDPATAGCPVETISFVCPIEVQTADTLAVPGYILDEEIQERLGALLRPGGDRIDVQRFFAETSMIREELPGRADRVLPFVVPPNWQPGRNVARVLFNSLASAPWLTTETPSQGLRTSETPRRRALVTELSGPENEPSETYFDLVVRARDAVDHFETIEPPNELAGRLSRNVLVAQSRWWWDDIGRGADYALDSEQEVMDELSKIEIVGPEQITLTSQTGEVQFLVVNGTGYPVMIDVVLESAKLDLPGGEPRVIEGAQQRLAVRVTTQASGVFPLTARLETPDGFAFGTPHEITIRSTEFNEIALGITFGALAFLVLFYVVRGVRRRRGGSGRQEAGASPA